VRIGIDTAILIRAHDKAAGPARELLLLIREKEHTLIVSPYVLKEVARVLHYPRLQKLFRLTEQEIERHLGMLRSMADMVEPASGPSIVLEDPEDDPIV
jgi:putative PIN family toxin of toxin-antitoxin system